MGESILSVRFCERTAILRLQRPERLNALTATLVRELTAALAGLADHPTVGCLVLTGEGRAFCAGADIAQGHGAHPAGGASRGDRAAAWLTDALNPLVQRMWQFDKPIIAAVNGVAAGGGVGLALASDIVVAARSASFVQVFCPRLALVPDMGCTWFAPRLVGRSRAMALALLGEELTAAEAERWGLIWRCVDDEQLMPVALRLADQLGRGSPSAAASTKRLINDSLDRGLVDHLRLETQEQRKLANSADHDEGLLAFHERREPRFTRHSYERTRERVNEPGLPGREAAERTKGGT